MAGRSYMYCKLCLAQDEYWNCESTSMGKIIYFRSLRGLSVRSKGVADSLAS